MRQAEYFRGVTGQQREREQPTWWKKLLPPIVFFAIAFAIDMLTGQQYSSILGSLAIVASLISLFPAIVPRLAAIGAFAAVWAGFNLVRAFSEDVGIAVAGDGRVADAERSIFGGSLPSATLQDRFFDADAFGAHDVAFSIVHGSFFIVPFVVAGLLWWRRRSAFRLYTLATAATFGIGLIGFLLLPTAPPWMVVPNDVSRITHEMLETSTTLAVSDASGAFSFEPNHLAAMPSVHVAATVLVALAVRRFGRVAGFFGWVYAIAMSVAVVYLGEHYVLDAIAGWGIAIAGWTLARRFLR